MALNPMTGILKENRGRLGTNRHGRGDCHGETETF